MLIAQISDLHITSGEKAYGIVATDSVLQQCIEYINNSESQPDIVLVTGDISNTSAKVEYLRAKELLDNLNMPYFVIPGNHDHRADIAKFFPQNIGELSIKDNDGNHFINYVIDEYDIRLIAMDSQVIGEAGGEVCQTRSEWLNQQLAKNPEQPTIVFMHHPPTKFGIHETDVDGFEGTERLGDVIEKYPNIIALLCGHVHIQTHSLWRGTVMSTTPSMGLKLRLDLKTEESMFYNDQAEYQLHHCGPDKNLVSFAVSSRKLDGPYPFL